MADFSAKSQSGNSEVWDLWRRTLSPIPTLFGRLRYVAGLRDPQTGRYSHPTLSRALGAEDADRTLRRGHYQVFGQWLGLSLEEQKADLEDFLNGAGRPGGPLGYRDLAPPGAHEVERQLYVTDLETILELLDAGGGGG